MNENIDRGMSTLIIFIIAAAILSAAQSVVTTGIAGIMNDLGDHEAALEYYKKALSVFKEKLGREHPHTKAVMNSVKKLEENMSCGAE